MEPQHVKSVKNEISSAMPNTHSNSSLHKSTMDLGETSSGNLGNKTQQLANKSQQVHQLKVLQDLANESEQSQEAIQFNMIANGSNDNEGSSDSSKQNNTGIPNNLKAGIEKLSGYSIDDVKVHYNSDKPGKLNAHAFAQNTDIYIASGQEKQLPHEAWHIIQQKQGKVKSTKKINDEVDVNDEKVLEKEADDMGAKAVSIATKDEHRSTSLKKSSKGNSEVIVQRVINVADEDYEVDDVSILKPTIDRVRGQLTTWMTRSKANSPSKKLVKKIKGICNEKDNKTIKSKVNELFREFYDNQTFVDIDDLGRQAEQDVMLSFLGLDEFQGTKQQLDQFTFTNGAAGAGSKKQPFSVYRTMKFEHWDVYDKGGDIKKILHGHGGGLGQALHYFSKSKGKMDDVLVEFRFTDLSESQLVDYDEISKGGEGKGSKGGKLGAKSEKNDVFGLKNIFSVDLGKNKELIEKKKPEVILKQYAQPDLH